MRKKFVMSVGTKKGKKNSKKEEELSIAASKIDIYSQSQQEEPLFVLTTCSLLAMASMTRRFMFSLPLSWAFECLCSAGWHMEEGGEDECTPS